MKRENRASGVLAIALACAMATSSAPPVLAQTPAELTAARQDFKQGLELEQQGKYQEALEKLEATAKVKASAQVLFHIALCKENLGQWGEAIEGYERSVEQATKDGSATEVISPARERAAKLKEKRPKLTVVFASNESPDSLSIDGKTVEGNVAKAYPVDPGPHVVLAKKGDQEIREETKLGEGENMTLRLVFAGPSPAPPTVAYNEPAEQPKAEPVEAPKPSSAMRTTGWIVGAFGVVSLATAGGFYAARSSALDELERACAADLRCPPSAESTYDRAKTYTLVSGVALGVGIAAVGLGTVLIIAGKPKQEEVRTPTARFVPYAPNANLFGFGIEGAF